mmetsp:Transcript_1834/g.3736  ORF Transcript_1834/g.3736 Transcript_1834/m.3736 type:complete len:671 (+) Transcript_1834:217-2229(+)|eukprot:CAMPEP_0181310520 /NCGR_PEP_ID=MMETSP1101-20121128/12629_1 /TAXON_ID=46948 /ORGANISM="Rhodomonas abbreviata, Strain Caron Lab Isolate" /LENGTH=670 /DNA_ID=CAMNT_0023417153 /DNA_START=203 /DNA_END=2215 /DNA_ORIENTATION=+
MALAETDEHGWMVLSYCLVVVSLTAFALYAVLYTKFFRLNKSTESMTLDSTKGFITASNSQGMWRIAWSFYAGSVGAWCITGPPGYATFAGWVGMVFYALATGIPVIIFAFFGNVVQAKWPQANSLGDYVMMRFGPTARLLCIIVSLFNMSIFMLAEFTTIGGLFQDFVGSKNYPIIIVVAILTTGYTAYGGLLVSIVTDQVQATFSLLLLFVVTITVAVTFDQDLPENFGDLKESLGPNKAGYSAILVMPLSLMSATVFNEGMWQRVWAAEDPKALKGGGIIACIAIVTAVFLYGFSGFLAAWGGLIDFETANPNLYMFQVFRSGPGEGQATVSNWVSVLVLVLAATMNQSAIDSLQNGIAATLSSHFLKREPIMYARICVVFISIPICIVALENLEVLSIFLTGNMLGCCCFMPLLIGGMWDSPLGRRVVNETGMVFSCIMAVLISIAYGVGKHWDKNDASKSIRVGAKFTFVDQPYDWDYFLVAWGFSIATLLLFGLCTELLHRAGVEGVGITQILGKIPGFHALAQDSTAEGPGCMHTAVMACLGRPLQSQPGSPERAIAAGEAEKLQQQEAQMVFMPPGGGGDAQPVLYPVYEPANGMGGSGMPAAVNNNSHPMMMPPPSVPYLPHMPDGGMPPHAFQQQQQQQPVYMQPVGVSPGMPLMLHGMA